MFVCLLMSFFLGWLIIISYYLIKTRRHYFRLTQRTRHHSIDEILEKLIEEHDKNSHEINDLRKSLREMGSKAQTCFKKIGLIRFNPFGRTDGDKSFVVSLLNSNDSGLVVNFIYTHEGVRIYSKRIKNGKGEDFDLSDEEKKAIEKAH